MSVLMGVVHQLVFRRACWFFELSAGSQPLGQPSGELSNGPFTAAAHQTIHNSNQNTDMK